jgi:hypothetical protein
MEGDSTSASSDEEDSGVSGVDHGVFISVDDIDPTVGTKSRPSLAEILVTGGGDGETATSLATHPTTLNFAALISPVHSLSASASFPPAHFVCGPLLCRARGTLTSS